MKILCLKIKSALFIATLIMSGCGTESELTDDTNVSSSGASINTSSNLCQQNSSCQQQCSNWFQFKDEKTIASEYHMRGLLNSGAHYEALQKNQQTRESYYSCLKLPAREVISQPNSGTRLYLQNNICKNVLRCSQNCIARHPFKDPREIDSYYNAKGLRSSGVALKAHQENDILYNNFLNCLELKAIEVITP